MPKSLVEMCADIVAAQASQTHLSPEEMAESLHKVFQTLQEIQQRGEVPQRDMDAQLTETASQDPLSSIQRNQVICLECGQSFKLLSNRHLALHNLTPRQYKQKHGIQLTQALSARTLSARRRKIAKELGMGGKLAAWRETRRKRRRL
jgi:predicted transcriptional regulator